MIATEKAQAAALGPGRAADWEAGVARSMHLSVRDHAVGLLSMPAMLNDPALWGLPGGSLRRRLRARWQRTV